MLIQNYLSVGPKNPVFPFLVPEPEFQIGIAFKKTFFPATLSSKSLKIVRMQKIDKPATDQLISFIPEELLDIGEIYVTSILLLTEKIISVDSSTRLRYFNSLFCRSFLTLYSFEISRAIPKIYSTSPSLTMGLAVRWYTLFM